MYKSENDLLLHYLLLHKTVIANDTFIITLYISNLFVYNIWPQQNKMLNEQSMIISCDWNILLSLIIVLLYLIRIKN